MKTHSDFYLVFRFAYGIPLFLLTVSWTGQMGALAWLPGSVLAYFFYRIERWIVRREDLLWAVKQIKPLLFHQLTPFDATCRQRADTIRALLIDADNGNLLVKDNRGNVTTVKVYEIYFQDEYNMRESWDEYLTRADFVRTEIERRQLAFYRENDLNWVVQYWFKQQM